VELLGAFPLAKLVRDCSCFDDLDAREPDPVARSHLIVHLLNSTIQSGVTVFLVHVVITGTTLVAQPDTIVLDHSRVLLIDLNPRQGRFAVNKH